MKFNTFKEIKEAAISIKEPIQIMKGSIKPYEEKYEPEIEGKNGYYTTNNHVLTFVENGVQYVIPRNVEIESLLLKEGFKETGDIFVPFSDYGYPIEEADKWTDLMTKII